jgi:exodeoxyribonuclease VII small subunit
MTPKDAERSKATETDLTFEQALERLETLVEKLEEGTIPLEESLAAYVEGTRLVRHCLACLERAEIIRELTETSEGLELRRSALNRHVEENDEEEDEDEEDQDGRGN